MGGLGDRVSGFSMRLLRVARRQRQAISQPSVTIARWWRLGPRGCERRLERRRPPGGPAVVDRYLSGEKGSRSPRFLGFRRRLGDRGGGSIASEQPRNGIDTTACLECDRNPDHAAGHRYTIAELRAHLEQPHHLECCVPKAVPDWRLFDRDTMLQQAIGPDIALRYGPPASTCVQHCAGIVALEVTSRGPALPTGVCDCRRLASLSGEKRHGD